MDERSPLAKRIERELEEAGLAVVVEDTSEELVVTGIVDSEEERQAVLDIVRKGTGGTREVSDNVEVAGALPEETSIGNLSETEIAALDGAEAGLQDFESLMPGDFTDQRMSGAAGVVQAAASSESPSDGGDESGEDGDIVYVPPIDPVGTDRVVERHWLRRVTQQKTPIAVLARAEYGQLLQTVIDAIPVNDADQSTDYGLSIVVGAFSSSGQGSSTS